jgi:hypothetical protein
MKGVPVGHLWWCGCGGLLSTTSFSLDKLGWLSPPIFFLKTSVIFIEPVEKTRYVPSLRVLCLGSQDPPQRLDGHVLRRQ